MIGVIFIGALEQFLAKIIFRQHVQREYIGPCIVVDVCNIRTHRKLAYMGEGRLQDLLKTSILGIEITIILFGIVTGSINIGPAIFVQVCDGNR